MQISSFDRIFNNQYNALSNNVRILPEQKVDEVKIFADNSNKKTLIYASLAVVGLGLLILGRKKIGNFIKNMTKSLKTAEKTISKEDALKKLEDLRKAENETFWQSMKKKDGTYRDAMIGQNIHVLKEDIYKKLRLTSYKPEGFSKIEEITKLPTEKIKVIAENGWHYRMPINFKKGKTSHALERISLNVKPDKNLIKKLDEYFSVHAEDICGYYKTPCSFGGWSSRHDPITIYLHRSAKETTVLDDVAKIAKPYVRSTGNGVLLGKKYAEGCAWQISPSEKEKQEIFKRFEDIFGEKVAKKIAGYSSGGNLSSGEICAFNEILNKITGQNVEVLIP